MAARMYNVSRGFVIFGEQSLLRRGHNQILVNPRRYVRGLRRKPVAVIYPDGKRETLFKSKAEKHNVLKEKGKDRCEVSEKSGSKKRSVDAPNDKYIEDFNLDQFPRLRFEKAYAGDERLGRLCSVARSQNFREKEQKVLLEGRRLICDALSAGASPHTLFFNHIERLQELPQEKIQKTKLIKVKYNDIKTWSDLVTPPGLIAIFRKPDPSRLMFPKEARQQTVPLFLICDNVQDAGNLGTILRCAAAAGCDRVLLTKGCVDAWTPKVLRSAMGAHFRLPVFTNLDWEDIVMELPKNTVVHVADGCNVTRKEPDLGQTGSDPSDHIESDYYSSSDDDDDDDDEEEEDDEEELFLPLVKHQVYHENWVQMNTALVIGGETHGVSLEALRLVEKTDGRRLFVPMAQGVERLNSAITTSVLLFEGRRQLLNGSDMSHQRARLQPSV
ncbi:hypothetical protein DNTS_021551 [Danionella cerebrum]|uniref:RNA 2-O ribose methyltransferase substrate binding domain-containing protein n=1 Tax=Danionella cerebrum TaxID=2873325 RepID=A0A553QXD3_9TELE|nr:hypothetical protein DNTS_021551 [Danionella translucida]